MNNIDLRPLLPPVRSQGPRGTCAAFAVTAAHEFARYGPMGTFEDLSEEALYWNCKQVDGDMQSGTSFDSASDVLHHAGQPRAASWPYDGFRDENDGTYVPPLDALDPQFCFKATMVEVPATVQNIKECLANGQAVVLGISTFYSFLMAPHGRVPMPAANEAEMGGHAVLVVGCEEDAVQGQWFIFRNSWGDGWGTDGYGFLPYDYISKYNGEAWIIQP
jgi:C1A family cysteine protease